VPFWNPSPPSGRLEVGTETHLPRRRRPGPARHPAAPGGQVVCGIAHVDVVGLLQHTRVDAMRFTGHSFLYFKKNQLKVFRQIRDGRVKSLHLLFFQNQILNLIILIINGNSPCQGNQFITVAEKASGFVNGNAHQSCLNLLDILKLGQLIHGHKKGLLHHVVSNIIVTHNEIRRLPNPVGEQHIEHSEVIAETYRYLKAIFHPATA